MKLETENKVFIVKRGIHDCDVVLSNDTHTVLRYNNKLIKLSNDKIYKTKNEAEQTLHEEFNKNDLVYCIVDNELLEGIVLNSTNLNVTVLINDYIKRISKNNLIKLNRQKNN